MYAQKLEGESWIGEKIDPGKVDKMSGTAAIPDTVTKYLLKHL
jgi:hypothetical protein